MAYAGVIDAEHALRAGWVELWYQPKVDLQRQEMIGLEVFARARHPFHGVLPASVFLGGAADESLARLMIYTIRSVFRDRQVLSQRGVQVPITINVPTQALNNLRMIEDLIRHEQRISRLMFDFPEEGILANISRFSKSSTYFNARGIALGVDDFGQSLCSFIESFDQEAVRKVSRHLLQLKELTLPELKLARRLVTDVALDPRRAAMCKIVIDLIHHIGGKAVAIGLEKQADALVQQMGCDIGQGNRFGKPAPLAEVLTSLNLGTNRVRLRA
jgi:EAL domain-containing protein (putative c-di-GMP-specific phosphodiesterase class I)